MNTIRGFQITRPSFHRAAAKFFSIELGVISLFVGAGLIYQPWLWVTVGVAGVFWLARFVAFGRFSARTPADWSVGLLVLMLFVTLFVTPLPELTLPEVFRLLSGVALYYGIINWLDHLALSEGRLRTMWGGFILIGIALALFAMISVDRLSNKLPFIPANLYRHLPSFVIETVHPNVIAGYLAILLPLPVSAVLFVRKKEKGIIRQAALLVSLVMIITLVLTQSRGGLIAALAAIFMLAILRWRWAWMSIPILGLLTFAAVSFLGVSRVLESLAYRDALGTIEGRLEIWNRALAIVHDFPYTGIGMGNFGPIADKWNPFFLALPGTIPHAHNLFLQIAADLGLPGLIAWLGIFFAACLSAWEIYRQGRWSGQGWLAGLGAGLLSCQAALAVHGLIDAVTWGMVRPAPLVWSLWGMAVAGCSFARALRKAQCGLVARPNS